MRKINDVMNMVAMAEAIGFKGVIVTDTPTIQNGIICDGFVSSNIKAYVVRGAKPQFIAQR